MAEDIMEKKDGASVCARVWKAGGMRERDRERETRISPSYSGLHVTAHVLPKFGNSERILLHWRRSKYKTSNLIK
jgi:hypothetical protein